MSYLLTTLVEPLNSEPATRVNLLRFLIAYIHLLTAALENRAMGKSPADAPVGYDQLQRAGVGEDTLLWMLFQAHAEHVVAPAASSEGWQLKSSVVIGIGSGFRLTPLGEAFAERLIGALVVPEDDEEFEWMWGLLHVGRLTPRYDGGKRLLTWGRHPLKCYRHPSENQEAVLVAAEELYWPEWFYDPLPRGRGGNPKVRLHDTIKNLNRHQVPHLIHFKGDGTGTRVRWELK